MPEGSEGGREQNQALKRIHKEKKKTKNKKEYSKLQHTHTHTHTCTRPRKKYKQREKQRPGRERRAALFILMKDIWISQ
jgi:hypothetical protein